MLGRFLRGMHYFGASAMVLLIGIHVSRTYIMAAYKFPRELNWLTGAVLLLLTLALAFTGQLLRWDQIGGVVGDRRRRAGGAHAGGRGEQIGRFILAGDTIGGATLSRFFAFHVFFIPAIVFAFIGLHLALVLRHGISERTRDGAVVDPATYRGALRVAPQARRRAVLARRGLARRGLRRGGHRDDRAAGPDRRPARPGPAARPQHPRGLSAPRLVLPLVLRVAGARAATTSRSLIIVLGPAGLRGGAPAACRSSTRARGACGAGPGRRCSWSSSGRRSAIFWIAGERADWSPDFETRPLPASIIRDQRPEVVEGARLFRDKGCQFCHRWRATAAGAGPTSPTCAARMKPDEITARITNGGPNMPAYVRTLTPAQVRSLMAFLSTRKP